MLFFSIPEATAQQQTMKLTYSHFWPVGHPAATLIGEWVKEVEKRTNGRVSITIFTGGTLTPADKCYDGVVKDISDIGSSALSYTRGRFPLMEVTDLPLGCKNALISTRLANALYKKLQPKELSDVKVMYFQNIGPGIVHTSKKPVRTLEDLKGLRLSCSGLTAKIVAALGATPVAMTMPERYDALAKGLVDGVAGVPIASLAGFKWGEITKYSTQNFSSAAGTAFFVAMNKNKWNSLSAGDQQAIEKLNEGWIDKTGNVWDDYDKMGIEFALKHGNTIIALSKEEEERWAERMKGTFDDYLRDTKKRNLPGEEALRFCRDFLKTNQ
jgi:TRAP-type C4-dicarboxylate transport system substrate-binding protein